MLTDLVLREIADYIGTRFDKIYILSTVYTGVNVDVDVSTLSRISYPESINVSWASATNPLTGQAKVTSNNSPTTSNPLNFSIVGSPARSFVYVEGTTVLGVVDINPDVDYSLQGPYYLRSVSVTIA